MNRYILTMMAVLGMVVTNYAQDITGGVMYGTSVSSYGGASSENIDFKSGARYGVFLNFPVTAVLSIEPQFIVNEKGAETNVEIGRTVADIDYATVPLIFNFHLASESILTPKLFAGPYAAINMDDSKRVLVLDDDTEEITEVKLKKGDVGLVYGIGIDLRRNRFYSSLSATGESGLTRIGTGEYTPDLKNRTYALNLALGFKF